MAPDERDLLVRPGAQGKFSATLAAELFALTPYTDGLLFVSSGKLYRWAVGASSPTEILKSAASLSLTSASVQTSVLLGAGFLVDGVGAIHRTDGTIAAEVTELDRPGAPTGTLTYQSLAAISGLTPWAQNTIGGTVAPTSLLPYADRNIDTVSWTFENGASSTATGGANVLDANRDSCVELDGKDERAISAPLVLAANSAGDGYARLAVIEFEAAGEDTTKADVPTEVVDALVRSYSDTGGTTEITGTVQSWRSPQLQESKATKLRYLWDGRSITSAVPRSIRMIVEQPYDRPGNLGIDANHAAVYIPKQELGLSVASERLVVRQGSVQVWQGSGEALTPGGALSGQSDPSSATTPGRLLTAGLSLTHNFASAKNWVGVRTLGLEVFPAAGVSGLRLRLGFKVGSNWFYTSALDTPTGGGWAVAELRDVAASLTAVTHLKLEILGDLMVEGIQEGGGREIVQIGELRAVGNLSEGRPVWYKLVEMDQAADSTNLLDVIWSDGSPSTDLIEPTRGERMTRLKLPAKTNTGAEWFALYRFGGAFIPQADEPAQGHLLCLIQWAHADLAFGDDTDKGTAPRIVAFANPYVAWDVSELTLTDNTPDSWLEGADIYLTGREKAPGAPTAIASWDNRLWVAKGADLYASWRISAGATAGLYWSRLQLPESADPEAGIKGHWERLLLPPGDAIVRLIPLPEELVILSKQAIFVARRTDGVPLYSITRIRDADIAGPTNHRAACEQDGMAIWLAHDGLRGSAGGDVRRVHEELRQTIAAASEAERDAAVMTSTPTKTFLKLGSFLYVWHTREKLWTRWDVNASMGAEIEGNLYLAGGAKQIYEMSGTGDKALSSSTAAAITARIHSRKMGDAGRIMTPTHFLLDVVSGQAVTMGIVVHGDTDAANPTYEQSVGAGANSWRKRISGAAEGRYASLEVEVETASAFRFKGLAIDAVDRRQVNG